MPDQPSWITKVDAITKAVEASNVPFLDRPTIERLFGLRRRQAIALMHQIGGYQVGKTFLADREVLLRFLRDPKHRVAASAESDRFRSVLDTLGLAREELHLRRIAIPATASAYKLAFDGLPEGIVFEPGQLRICFEHPQQLLEKLFALSQALANDYESFEQAWSGAKQP